MIPARRKKRRGRTPTHPFDVQHGTDTGNLIPGDDLSTGHKHDRHITAYHGVAPSLFSKLMARWLPLAQHSVPSTAFVDIGAGKGRAMLLASEHPFRRVVGVELHPALAATARANVERWQETHLMPPIRIAEGDAMRLRFPAGPCLLFLFNPFDIVLMDRLMDRLETQFKNRPAELDVLYVNDEQRDMIRDYHKGFHELWRGRIFHSHEDRTADKAIIEHDAGGLYVTTGYEDCSIWRFGQ